MRLDAREIVAWAGRRGYAVALGRTSVLAAARQDILERLARGELDRGFYRAALSSLHPAAETAGGQAGETVVVLAVPRPAHRLTFLTTAGPFHAIVPPTYRGYSALPAALRDELALGPLPPDIPLTPLRGPLKSIAARLGLVSYGRNNVTYLPGQGSYHQLVGFVAGAPLGEAAPPLASLLSPACEGCFACAEACPTGAISEERFLLHGERCLTYHNERADPWPEWLPQTAHNCLVGCLACQEACPQNAGRLRVVDLEPVFTEEETALLLGSASPATGSATGSATSLATGPGSSRRGRVWRGIKAKLAGYGLAGYEKNLPRNLAACLEAGRSRQTAATPAG